jgi:hypothetical protein
MVTLGGKSNILEPVNHIATSMSSAPFDPKFNKKHVPPMGSRTTSPHV